jgi:hypothetical protein
MSHATSAPVGASPPRLRAVPAYRVIYHAQVCPECGSDDITESEVETGEGITEIALTCRTCGTAWPVACVVEWSTPR